MYELEKSTAIARVKAAYLAETGKVLAENSISVEVCAETAEPKGVSVLLVGGRPDVPLDNAFIVLLNPEKELKNTLHATDGKGLFAIGTFVENGKKKAFLSKNRTFSASSLKVSNTGRNPLNLDYILAYPLVAASEAPAEPVKTATASESAGDGDSSSEAPAEPAAAEPAATKTTTKKKA
ncbi:hypothetical protein SAMN05421780_1245 [Flexibacter flexilis DSM 6793]|uniref:Uncharacterized protein n=1 Tax=Flexibacter flexilis DSM 6793 TaxID=927664 RepID=A0A1I1NY12_9BACT|nr:hypothetical protein [Flexibacter flexilis]SFD02489.1 hypothetical protein SAMN05421780_1245 [Flexibacter flexilis DSM 6793]